MSFAPNVGGELNISINKQGNRPTTSLNDVLRHRTGDESSMTKNKVPTEAIDYC